MREQGAEAAAAMKKVWNNTTVFVIATALAAGAVAVIVYPVFPALVWILLFLCWASYRLRLIAIARFGANAAFARSATNASASYWPDDEDENTSSETSEG